MASTSAIWQHAAHTTDHHLLQLLNRRAYQKTYLLTKKKVEANSHEFLVADRKVGKQLGSSAQSTWEVITGRIVAEAIITRL